MKNSIVSWLRGAAAMALLGGLAVAAQARVNWSVGVDFGQPIVSALPQGAVSMQIAGGNGRHWHHGGRGYRPGRWHGGGIGWVLVAPPVVFPLVRPVDIDYLAPVAPPAPSRADPVIYPRNGQDAQQTELDRQACNRWATTQPAALADASVFHRAVEACMDGRGYTLK